jgi:phenylpropionate dioxygenase-like ring-hydroxylating dioxygenase large terminal subunit
MSAFNYWHPVLQSHQLRRKPVGVRVMGRSLALFRTLEGTIGALDDICPHRRMRLSVGQVNDKGCLACSYHGWTFDAKGNGESPGTPRLHALVESFDACESRGLVWVRARGSKAELPSFDVTDYRHMCILEHRMKVPLELALDNFCETEHTAVAHNVFGFDLDSMNDVRVAVEATETTVSVRCDGPAKRLALPFRFLLGVRRSHWFHSHWTTHFNPVSLIIDHWWGNATGSESLVRWRAVLFLVPIEDQETAVWTLGYAQSRWPVPGGGLPMFKWLMRQTLKQEIQVDVDLVSHLANTDSSIEGMKLGRFDRVLGLTRERIAKVYRNAGTETAVIPPT